MWLFYYFNFEMNYDDLKSKSTCILLTENINFDKNETKSIMENSTYSFRETNVWLSSYKSRKLKVKLWWIGARERKQICVFFFKICVFSQCIGYWIHFQKIHYFEEQKILLHALLLLDFEIVESLQYVLKCKCLQF